jgi:hypothetical protein
MSRGRCGVVARRVGEDLGWEGKRYITVFWQAAVLHHDEDLEWLVQADEPVDCS